MVVEVRSVIDWVRIDGMIDWKRDGNAFMGDRNVLYLDRGGGYMSIQTYLYLIELCILNGCILLLIN